MWYLFLLVFSILSRSSAKAESLPSSRQCQGHDIFHKFADNLLDAIGPEELAAHIHVLPESSKEAFHLEAIVEAQLNLYDKFVRRDVVNDLYTFNVAFYFLQIREHKDFATLGSSLRERLDKTIASLPTSVQYLFFKPSFCLLNLEYSEFIYTTNAIEIDNERRHIFTWRVRRFVKGNGAWKRYIRILSDPNKAETKLRFALKSSELDMYLYREQLPDLNNRIVAWRNRTDPSKTSWSVDLHNASLVFQQDGVIMCASYFVHDNDRRYVLAYNEKGYTPEAAACQWLAQECPSY